MLNHLGFPSPHVLLSEKNSCLEKQQLEEKRFFLQEPPEETVLITLDNSLWEQKHAGWIYIKLSGGSFLQDAPFAAHTEHSDVFMFLQPNIWDDAPLSSHAVSLSHRSHSADVTPPVLLPCIPPPESMIHAADGLWAWPSVPVGQSLHLFKQMWKWEAEENQKVCSKPPWWGINKHLQKQKDFFSQKWLLIVPGGRSRRYAPSFLWHGVNMLMVSLPQPHLGFTLTQRARVAHGHTGNQAADNRRCRRRISITISKVSDKLHSRSVSKISYQCKISWNRFKINAE